MPIDGHALARKLFPPPGMEKRFAAWEGDNLPMQRIIGEDSPKLEPADQDRLNLRPDRRSPTLA